MALNTPSIQSIYHSREFASPLVQAILLIVVIALFGWFLVRPEVAQTLEKRAELKVAEQKRAAVENDKRELNRLISELQSSQTEVRITDEALPLSGRVSRLNVLLDTLARSSGMQIAQINSEDPDDVISAGNKEVLENPYGVDRSLQTTTATIVATGTMDQFRNFLQLLERSGRLIDVSALDVTGEEAATKFRLTIKAYAYEVDSE